MFFYIVISWILIGFLDIWSLTKNDKIDEYTGIYGRKVFLVVLFLLCIVFSPIILFVYVIPDVVLDVKIWIVCFLVRRKVNKILKKSGSKERV